MVPAERLGGPCPLHPSLLPGASVASQVASLRTQQTRKVGGCLVVNSGQNTFRESAVGTKSKLQIYL